MWQGGWYVHVSAGIFGGLSPQIPMILELQAAISCLALFFEPILGILEEQCVCALNH